MSWRPQPKIVLKGERSPFLDWLGNALCLLFAVALFGGWFVVIGIPEIEAWLNKPPAPPSCSYRMVPQPDGTILAYKC